MTPEERDAGGWKDEHITFLKEELNYLKATLACSADEIERLRAENSQIRKDAIRIANVAITDAAEAAARSMQERAEKAANGSAPAMDDGDLFDRAYVAGRIDAAAAIRALPLIEEDKP